MIKKIYKFSTSTCCMCKQVSALLDKKGIAYEDINCEEKASKKLMKKYYVRGVPTLVIVCEHDVSLKLKTYKEIKDWIDKQ